MTPHDVCLAPIVVVPTWAPIERGAPQGRVAPHGGHGQREVGQSFAEGPSNVFKAGVEGGG